MAFRNPGFSAWFEDFEINMMGGNSRFRTTFDEYLNIGCRFTVYFSNFFLCKW